MCHTLAQLVDHEIARYCFQINMSISFQLSLRLGHRPIEYSSKHYVPIVQLMYCFLLFPEHSHVLNVFLFFGRY